MAGSGSDPEVIRMDDWIRTHGQKSVPVESDDKKARIRSFAEADYIPPDSGLWRRERLNIGMVTGAIVDVDLDCPEAAFLAQRLLPHTTMVFGRASKPRSHWMYLGEGPLPANRIAWTDPVNGDVILEIRGAGHQTVMPGSTHPSGEKIEWSGDWPDAATPTPNDELLRFNKLIAAGTLLIRNWHEGSRNELTKYVTGMLCQYGWSDAIIEILMEGVFDYCGDSDPSRMKTVKLTMRKFADGRPVGGAGKLRGLLDERIIISLQQWLGSDKVNAVLEYNERFAVLFKGNKFGIACLDVVKPGWPVMITSRTDFLHWTENEWIPSPDPDGKPVAKAKIWLTNLQRRTYREIEFLPGVEDSGEVFNLWTGWAVKPAADASGNGCDGWLELLREVVCGGNLELYRRILHFFAMIVREPMNRAPMALVIIGLPGAGKSLLISYFGRILGRAGFVSVSKDDLITGSFNAHLAQCLLLQSEEAIYAGDKKQRGMLKDLITAPIRPYHPKFFDVTFISNFTRLVITSNYEQPAPVEARDRRFLTADMEQRVISKELADKVVMERDNGGPEALFRYLLELKDYDPKLCWTPYDDATRGDQIALNLEPMDAWWHHTLVEGQILPQLLMWGTQGNKDDRWPSVVKIGVLYAAMATALGKQRFIPSNVQFAVRMRKWFGDYELKVSDRRFVNINAGDVNIPREWQLLSDRGPAWVNMPPLAECRAAFSRHLGHEVVWLTEEESMDDGDNHPDGSVVVKFSPEGKRSGGRPATRRKTSGSDDDGNPTF